MAVEYEVNQELTDLIAEMVAEQPEFSALSVNQINIVGCLKIDMVNETDYKPCKGPPAVAKKVSSHYTAFLNDTKYVLIFDAGTWHNHPQRRSAAIHRALMRIGVSVTDSGKVKLSPRSPDVQEFTATIRRYGPSLATSDEYLRSFLTAARQVVQSLSDDEQSDDQPAG